MKWGGKCGSQWCQWICGEWDCSFFPPARKYAFSAFPLSFLHYRNVKTLNAITQIKGRMLLVCLCVVCTLYKRDSAVKAFIYAFSSHTIYLLAKQRIRNWNKPDFCWKPVVQISGKLWAFYGNLKKMLVCSKISISLLLSLSECESLSNF